MVPFHRTEGVFPPAKRGETRIEICVTKSQFSLGASSEKMFFIDKGRRDQIWNKYWCNIKLYYCCHWYTKLARDSGDSTIVSIVRSRSESSLPASPVLKHLYTASSYIQDWVLDLEHFEMEVPSGVPRASLILWQD